MREGRLMVEQQPGIFREMGDVVEEFTVYTGSTLCGRYSILVSLGAELY
jgi:hypothetical protein